MFFRQVIHDDLACASYLIADGGEAAVVDPKWEIHDYLRLAAEAGAEIRHVLETHHHADHVSGRARLQAVTGASAHVPGDGGHEGERVRVGQVEIEAVATPGHRPEHTAYLVIDGGRDGAEPCLLLSGDSLLVGDLARPDLAGAAREGASALFDTVQRVLGFGDHVELWPAHVGGSLCGGGALSARRSSTIGYERRVNPLLSCGEREQFVTALTRCLPPRPPTVERVVALNRSGAESPAPLASLGVTELLELVDGGATILDVRPSEQFDAAHLAGAINLPAAGTGLGTRAGWAIAPGVPIVIVAGELAAAHQVAERLYAAGVWDLSGVVRCDLAAWRSAGLAVRRAPVLTPELLAAQLRVGGAHLLDVRDDAEWQAGHVAGSIHMALPVLGDGSRAVLPVDRPLAVACASGRRAALAASVLRRRGYADAARVTGGVPDLAHHGVRLVRGA